MRLTEIMDAAHRPMGRERRVYLVSFDIQWAFGNVSRRQLMESLKRMEIEPRARRVVRKCLTTRTFRVKMASTNGTLSSNMYPIARGLLQGGVLSPLL